MPSKEIPNYKKTIFQQIKDEEYLPIGVHEEFCYTVWSTRGLIKQSIELIDWIKKSEKGREWNIKQLEVLIHKVANEFEAERKINKPLDS